MVAVGGKRKGPPTFHHLPINRAKKLKQSWIETAKIKSKWKAEKRKLKPATSVDDSEVNKGLQRNQSEDPEKPSPMSTSAIIHPSRRHRHDIPADTSTSRQKEEPSTGPAPSLRDLAREAYSPSSLHTFKSGTSHRKRVSTDSGKQQTNRQGESIRGTGRGQPNMKLRMDVMLEKIKRDFT